MWWALQTVTTVGYGDVVPQQTAGKIIASFLLLGGLSLLAVITGAITSSFVTRAQNEQRAAGRDPVIQKLLDMTEQLDDLKATVTRLERGDGRPESESP
jgi:voltage-gated potassium channel